MTSFPRRPEHRNEPEALRDTAPGDGPLRAEDHWRVNLAEPWEIRFWMRELGCSEEALREAVRNAGDRAGAVRAQLLQSRTFTSREHGPQDD